MGKIKVRTLGDESLEQKQKEKSKQRSKEKKFVKGTKGGERVVAVGPSEEELARLQLPPQSDGGQAALEVSKGVKKAEKRQAKSDKRKERARSKSYQTVAKVLDRNKKYSLSEALVVLEKLKRSKFDETVELHINTIETGVSGNIALPHGTGKATRVAIADPTEGSGQVDDLLKKIEQGIIEFDVLLATPAAMSKLARVAKILGPRGLMPNPKNGTLTKDPQTLALSFAKGQMNFRTEAKAPIMHLTVGKLSYGAKKLSENIQALIDAVKKEKIRNVTLKSTMSPGIKLDI